MMEGFRWVGIVAMALWAMELAQLATAAGTGNVAQAEEEAPGTAVDRPAVAWGAVVDCAAPGAVVDGPAPVVDGPVPGAVVDGPGPGAVEDPDLEDAGSSSSVEPDLRAAQVLAAAEAEEAAREEEDRERRRKRRDREAERPGQVSGQGGGACRGGTGAAALAGSRECSPSRCHRSRAAGDGGSRSGPACAGGAPRLGC